MAVIPPFPFLVPVKDQVCCRSSVYAMLRCLCLCFAFGSVYFDQ